MLLSVARVRALKSSGISSDQMAQVYFVGFACHEIIIF